MGTRSRYEIDLRRPIESRASDGRQARLIAPDDLDGLARLMLDAYVGTIDYEDETLEDAVEEVRSFFGEDPLLAHSHVVEVDGRLAAAILVMIHDGGPFVRSVMTLPDYKRQGLARLVVSASIRSLAADGYDKIVLYITDGNVASEALFRALGAVEIPDGRG